MSVDENLGYPSGPRAKGLVDPLGYPIGGPETPALFSGLLTGCLGPLMSM
jgi:hypothetical protein